MTLRHLNALERRRDDVLQRAEIEKALYGPWQARLRRIGADIVHTEAEAIRWWQAYVWATRTGADPARIAKLQTYLSDALARRDHFIGEERAVLREQRAAKTMAETQERLTDTLLAGTGK